MMAKIFALMYIIVRVNKDFASTTLDSGAQPNVRFRATFRLLLYAQSSFSCHERVRCDS